MAKLNILVTAVGGDLGQSAVKCLKDSGYSIHITGCDMNPYAGGRIGVDAFFQAPPVKKEKEFRDFLLKTIDKQRIDYVFPMSDVEIIFFNENRQLCKESGAAFIMNEKHIVDTFMDKYRTVQFFKEKGIPYPETWLPPDYRNQLDFPLILKKQRGSGSQFLIKVKDDEELRFHLKRSPDSIIQEYLPGEDNEYTAGIFSDGTTCHTITFKRTLAPGGFSQHAELAQEAEAAEFPGKIAEVLDFKGSLNVQFRLTPKGCVPFEINPRFSSTVFLRHKFGFKDVTWSLDLAEGKTIAYTPRYKKGIAVRTFSEVFFDME